MTPEQEELVVTALTGMLLLAFVPTQPGWEHVKTYTDQFSGAYAERPALQKALRDARLGRFDILLVYRVDRFARSLKVLVGLLEDLEHAGVVFRSATEPTIHRSPSLLAGRDLFDGGGLHQLGIQALAAAAAFASIWQLAQLVQRTIGLRVARTHGTGRFGSSRARRSSL